MSAILCNSSVKHCLTNSSLTRVQTPQRKISEIFNVVTLHISTGGDIDLQIEAAWCFTNLAGSTREYAVRVLKASGAYLITYLSGSNVLLQDLCAWTLGNLAGDCEECRRMMLDQGAVDPLVHLLKVVTFGERSVLHTLIY